MPDMVHPPQLAAFVQERLADIDPQHILPIIKVLLEEMLADIKLAGLDIIGLGRFEIRQMKDHGHNDVNHNGEWVVSPGLKKTRLILEEPLRELLLTHLSRRKTFPAPLTT